LSSKILLLGWFLLFWELTIFFGFMASWLHSFMAFCAILTEHFITYKIHTHIAKRCFAASAVIDCECVGMILTSWNEWHRLVITCDLNPLDRLPRHMVTQTLSGWGILSRYFPPAASLERLYSGEFSSYLFLIILATPSEKVTLAIPIPVFLSNYSNKSYCHETTIPAVP
jgi:hypothetical protein